MAQTLTINLIIEELRTRKWRKQTRVARWYKAVFSRPYYMLLEPVDPLDLMGSWTLSRSDRPGDAIRTWPSAKAMFRDGAAESPAV